MTGHPRSNRMPKTSDSYHLILRCLPVQIRFMQLLLTISIFDQFFALALRNLSAFCIVRWNTLKSEHNHFRVRPLHPIENTPSCETSQMEVLSRVAVSLQPVVSLLLVASISQLPSSAPV